MKTASILLAFFLLASAPVSAQPSISSVLNAASADALISPGCLVTITGAGLADTIANAPEGSSSSSLAGVMVIVNGIAAELLSVSPTQINLVLPEHIVIPANTVVPLIVTSGGTVGKPYNLRLLRNAPAVFTVNGSGNGRAMLYNGGSVADTVSPGDIVTLFATGLGPTAGQSEKVVEPFEVYLGDRRADVISARRAPGLPGVYQIDVTVPALATDRLYLRAGGWQSNITQIGIQGGANVVNVTGSVDSLYPSSERGPGAATSFSVMLYAGTFSTGFEIAPSAAPFDIAAVGEGAASIISIDPTLSCEDDSGIASQGKYTASVSTITADGVRGDFSGSIVPLWDYSTCDPATWACLPLNLSNIPPPRLAPAWNSSAQSLPFPNVIFSPGVNAFVQVAGCLADLLQPASSHLVIDAQHGKLFSIFGGFQQVPLGFSKTRVSTFSLYVDGVKIASKDVSYGVRYRP
jgi:uncharacterized protein (TIGR03437 family)